MVPAWPLPPVAQVKLPTSVWVLPVGAPKASVSAVPSFLPATLIPCTPNCAKVNSSTASLMPFWLASFHSLTLAKAASAALNCPSLLLSRSARASKPSAARCPALGPRVSRVLSPKSSRPESIVPLPFRSRTTMASPAPTQPVALRRPSPSWSKRMGYPGSMPLLLMPPPSRSRMMGQLTAGMKGSQDRAPVVAVLTVGLIGNRVLGSTRLGSKKGFMAVGSPLSGFRFRVFMRSSFSIISPKRVDACMPALKPSDLGPMSAGSPYSPDLSKPLIWPIIARSAARLASQYALISAGVFADFSQALSRSS